MSVRGLRIALLGAVAAGLVTCATAAGAVDPQHTVVSSGATLANGGHSLRLTGHVRCPGCSRFTLAITVSQRGGGLAQGGVRCVCRGATERWIVVAKTRQASRLHAGTARACTWLQAEDADGVAIDAYQWCRSVTLRA